MSVTIREADIVRDRDVILDILQDGELEHATLEHYVWRYGSNPDGPARVWLAVDGSGDEIGAAAAFPRRMRVQGAVATGWVLGDFAIRKAHRTLGPAVALQRACMRAASESEIPVLYDHPSAAMVAIYRRLGVDSTGSIVRLVRRLRIEDKVESAIGAGLVARGIGGLGNLLLRTRDSVRGQARDVHVSRLDGNFDERADALDSLSAADHVVAGIRDRAYLDWRYVDHPTIRFESWIAERGTDLVGLVVLRREGPIAVLAELNTTGPGPARALLEAAARHYRSRRCVAINAPALEGSGLAGTLGDEGFVPRESTPFVVAFPYGDRPEGGAAVDRSWFYSDGDRDV